MIKVEVVRYYQFISSSKKELVRIDKFIKIFGVKVYKKNIYIEYISHSNEE